MKKILLANIPIFFFPILLYSQNNKEKLEQNDKILIYENYYQQNIKIPKSLSLLKLDCNVISDTIGTIEMFDNISNYRKLPLDICDFLFEQDIISEKAAILNTYIDFEQDSSISGFIENRVKEYLKWKKERTTYYYLGKRNLINDSIISYFVLTSLDMREHMHMKEDVSNELFLINVVNYQIKSITKIAFYCIFEGHMLHLYTEILENNIFIMKSDSWAGDVIIDYDGLSEEEIEEFESSNPIPYSKFSFDDNGYLKIEQ